MTEQELRDSFDRFPLDERLRLVRGMLADIEAEIRQAKKQTSTPKNGLSDLTDFSFIPGETDILDELRGGAQRHIDSLRLTDATEYLRVILQKHGYIKKHPSFEQLARTLHDEESKLMLQRSKPDWSEWVARDGDVIDGPKDRQWKDWVVEDTPKSDKG